jgi:HD-like signal output (HDOD) protein
MKNILFVDDEVKVLDGIRRMLRPMRTLWNMDFVTGAEQALARLDERPFDVVVSDMRMPGMDGAQLLTEVMHRHPQTVRIILSGQSDQEMVLKSVGPTHQFLAKPCDAGVLQSTVARACALRDQLTDGALQELTSRIKTLPSLPTVYAQMLGELRSPDTSTKRIGELVARDVAMTAKILQLVNSSFFGLSRTITDPVHATSLLGTDTIRALVLTVGVFAQFEGVAVPGYSLESLSTHSLRTAAMSKAIVQTQGGEKLLLDAAFLAGLLHDVGQLILVANLPQVYGETLARAADRRLPLWEAEKEAFGATHADVGGYLMGLWGLPDTIIEAIVHHHSPARSAGDSFNSLTAVHVADFMGHDMDGDPADGIPARLDEEYLDRLGLADRLPRWRDACELVVKEGAQR